MPVRQPVCPPAVVKDAGYLLLYINKILFNNINNNKWGAIISNAGGADSVLEMSYLGSIWINLIHE